MAEDRENGEMTGFRKTDGFDLIFDLIVVGGGPSGLFCALSCAGEGGRKILVLEKNSSPGRKLLISGMGHCNITHDGDMQSFLHHYGDRGRFLRPALLGFSNQDLVAFFKERGLSMVQKENGKIFPDTERSADVLEILTTECRKRGIEIRCGRAASSIVKSDDGFSVSAWWEGRSEGRRESYFCKMLALATGGCSYPATGSSGDGYEFARLLGHSIVDIGPALVPVAIQDYPFSELAGISLADTKVSLYRRAKIREICGDILFTHSGLSGPAILDLSRYIMTGDTLKLSIAAERQRGELEKWLVKIGGNSGGLSLQSRLSELPLPKPLPARLIKGIMQLSGIPPGLQPAQLSREMRNALLENLIALPLVVSGTGGYNQAMTTRGGVDTREVDPRTMQSRLVNGLYLLGEVLDVDGDCGGYNLQAAFSTAMLAARSIKSRLAGEIPDPKSHQNL